MCVTLSILFGDVDGRLSAPLGLGVLLFAVIVLVGWRIWLLLLWWSSCVSAVPLKE